MWSSGEQCWCCRCHICGGKRISCCNVAIVAARLLLRRPRHDRRLLSISCCVMSPPRAPAVHARLPSCRCPTAKSIRCSSCRGWTTCMLGRAQTSRYVLASCCMWLGLCLSGAHEPGVLAWPTGDARRQAVESSELKSALVAMLAGLCLVRSACFIRQLMCFSEQRFLQTRSACHTHPSPLAGPAAPDRCAQAEWRAGHFHGP